MEPKIREVNDHVEKELFRFYNENFADFGFKFTRDVRLMDYNGEGLSEMRGVIALEYCDIRFIDFKISGIIKEDKPIVKNIPFAWIAESSMADFIEPLVCAEIDFYDILFGKLRP